jgi:hypothetical protein
MQPLSVKQVASHPLDRACALVLQCRPVRLLRLPVSAMQPAADAVGFCSYLLIARKVAIIHC